MVLVINVLLRTLDIVMQPLIFLPSTMWIDIMIPIHCYKPASLSLSPFTIDSHSQHAHSIIALAAIDYHRPNSNIKTSKNTKASLQKKRNDLPAGQCSMDYYENAYDSVIVHIAHCLC